jgi:hypothetical protein
MLPLTFGTFVVDGPVESLDVVVLLLLLQAERKTIAAMIETGFFM